MKSIGLLLQESSALMKRRFEQEARPQQLTLMQWRVLAELSRSGPVRQVALVEAINVSAMTVSDVADRLEKAGLVSRVPAPSDSRAKEISLTAAGERKVAEMRDIAVGVFAEVFDGIPPEDLDTLSRTLTRIVANLGTDAAAARKDTQDER